MTNDRSWKLLGWLLSWKWDMIAVLGTALMVYGAYILMVGALNSSYWTWNWMTYIIGGCIVTAIAYMSGLWEERSRAERD